MILPAGKSKSAGLSNDNTALKMNIIVIFSPLFVVPQKGFIKTFKAFIKSFEAPQRSVKIKT